MRYLKLLTLLMGVVVLALGCAKKKEDAAKLEQEMMGQETPVAVDTSPDAGAVPPETMVATTPEEDVPPVPQSGERRFVPTEPEGEGYAVQVAACESLEYAQHLADLYLQRGYDPYVTSAVVNGRTYYRVRIGQFGSRPEADELTRELKDLYSVETWID